MANVMENPDLTLGVEFFVKPVENLRKTREEGRRIFEEREYVRIRFPADNKRELVAPANEMHYVPARKTQMTYAERFAASYQAFKDQNLEFVEGTPLVHARFISTAKAAELAALNVRTVEQLAGLPTQAMRKLGMGGGDLVREAQEYLQGAASHKQVDDLQREIEELKAQLAGQQKPDQYADFSDEDLVNMINDAGGKVPPGRRNRDKLVAEMDRLTENAA